MSTLTEALRSADESYLVGMSNKGLYKRAVKDLETADGTVTPDGDTLIVGISGETIVLRDPLWESTCSCPSRSICRHIITAILYAKSSSEDGGSVTLHPSCSEEGAEPAQAACFEAGDAPENSPQCASAAPSAQSCLSEETGSSSDTDVTSEPEPVVQETVPVLSETVRSTASDGYALLAELLCRGLVRMPENLADHLGSAAVHAHSQDMADAERGFRELSGLLGDLRERRAVFRTGYFLSRLTKLAAHLEGIAAGRVTELGAFRRTYEAYPGELHLLPVGEREVVGGEYEGKIYYFLDLDQSEQKFWSWSDLRPVFYESVAPKKRTAAPWNAAVPMQKLMESRLTLVKAKVCGGKLSSSSETEIAVRTKGDLNCPELRRHIHTDFRELAVWLAGRDRSEDTERLCLICPKLCRASRFDTHAQELRMTMEDAAGDLADLRVGYRKETKEFIEELERIGRIMLEKPEADYVWLCLADFADGELVLSPLEVYNFITVEPQPVYQLPQQYRARENRKAPQILAFLEEVEDWLCELLQCGLRAAPDGRGRRLSQKAERCGMDGLASLITALADKAENYRHSLHADPQDALREMTRITGYLHTARERLALISALNTMLNAQ